MNEKTLGARIAELRRAKGYSQEYVAEAVGVSRQAVSKWEQDQSAPDTYNLIALAGILGVTVEYLATGAMPQAPAGAETAPPPPPPVPPMRDPLATQRVVGYILLAVGLTGLLVGLFLSGILAIAGGLLVLGGILCLAVRRHLGLVLTWVYWGVCNLLTTLMTGVLWHRESVTDQEMVFPVDTATEAMKTVAAVSDAAIEAIELAEESLAPAAMSTTWTGIFLLVQAAWLLINIVLTVCTVVRARRAKK